MEIDLNSLRDSYRAVHSERASDTSARHRIEPRLTDYDYLALSTLPDDVATLVARVHGGGTALDIGSGSSPYRDAVAAAGFDLRTLDVTPESGPDYVGTAESTGLDDESFDLVVCTQVLEHVDDPFGAGRAIARILRPGGHAILSVPHVWFFHPHPHDHWRFTQEGIARLVRSCELEPLAILAQGGSLLTVCQIANFLVYGVLGRLGAPIYAGLNLAAKLDRVAPNDLFCHNFACLAVRPRVA
jgi:SAM-dependent methyltransferase